MDNILELEFESQDLGETVTIKQFFFVLLSRLWNEGEQFDGKYPFGCSGWDGDLIVCLIKNNLIEGTLDEDGYIEEVDEKEVRSFVHENIIKSIFNLKTDEPA